MKISFLLFFLVNESGYFFIQIVRKRIIAVGKKLVVNNWYFIELTMGKFFFAFDTSPGGAVNCSLTVPGRQQC